MRRGCDSGRLTKLRGNERRKLTKGIKVVVHTPNITRQHKKMKKLIIMLSILVGIIGAWYLFSRPKEMLEKKVHQAIEDLKRKGEIEAIEVPVELCTEGQKCF